MVHGAIDPDVRGVYRRCAALQLRRDPTFFIATRRLPGDVRPAVHALYGFVRGADDIVDAPGAGAIRRGQLDAWQAELERGLAAGRSDHPIIGALVHAGQRYDLPLGELRVYMDSMRVDCDRVRMADRAALDAYMNGSAAAVGRIMAPLLGAPEADRETVARARRRLPADELHPRRPRGLGDGPDLPPGPGRGRPRASSAPSDAFRERIGSEAARARALFADTRSVVGARPPRMRTAMRVAARVYERVLDRVERIGFDVLGRRTALGPLELASAVIGAARAT